MNILRGTLYAATVVVSLGVVARIDSAMAEESTPTPCASIELWHAWDDSKSDLSDPYPVAAKPGSVDLLVWQASTDDDPTVCT